jgi:hypothetical protein
MTARQDGSVQNLGFVPFYFETLGDPELSSASKSTLEYLRYRQGKNSHCWVPTAELSGALRVSNRAVLRRITELEGLGKVSLTTDGKLRRIAVQIPSKVQHVRLPIELFECLSPTLQVVYCGLARHLPWDESSSEVYIKVATLAAELGLGRDEVMVATRTLDHRNIWKKIQRHRRFEDGTAYSDCNYYQLRQPSRLFVPIVPLRNKTRLRSVKNPTQLSLLPVKNPTQTPHLSVKNPTQVEVKNPTSKDLLEQESLTRTKDSELDHAPKLRLVAGPWTSGEPFGQTVPWRSDGFENSTAELGTEAEKCSAMTHCVDPAALVASTPSLMADRLWHEEVEHIEKVESEEESLKAEVKPQARQQDQAALKVQFDALVQQATQKNMAAQQKKIDRQKKKTTGDISFVVPVYQHWVSETRGFKTEFPAWDAKDMNRVKHTFLTKNGPEASKRMISYVCQCWPLINKRLFHNTNPYPDLEMLLKFSTKFMQESATWAAFLALKKEMDDYKKANPDAWRLPEPLTAKLEEFQSTFDMLGLVL